MGLSPAVGDLEATMKLMTNDGTLVAILRRALANEGLDGCCLPEIPECHCWRCDARRALGGSAMEPMRRGRTGFRETPKHEPLGQGLGAPARDVLEALVSMRALFGPGNGQGDPDCDEVVQADAVLAKAKVEDVGPDGQFRIGAAVSFRQGGERFEGHVLRGPVWGGRFASTAYYNVAVGETVMLTQREAMTARSMEFDCPDCGSPVFAYTDAVGATKITHHGSTDGGECLASGTLVRSTPAESKS